LKNSTAEKKLQEQQLELRQMLDFAPQTDRVFGRD